MALPATPEAIAPLRHDLRAWLADAGTDETSAQDLLVAVTEACASAVEHAYAFDSRRTIDLRASREGAQIDITIADDGGWMTPDPGASRRGRGLPLMRALVDEATVDTTAGTTIQLRKTAAGDAR